MIILISNDYFNIVDKLLLNAFLPILMDHIAEFEISLNRDLELPHC